MLRAKGFRNPIIALTANAKESDRQHCLESGFTDFLSKPIDSHELYRMLRRYGRTR
jgi:CheY-like chemotaxis protein